MRSLIAYLLAAAAITAGIGFGYLDWLDSGQDNARAARRSLGVPVVVAEVVRAPIADSLAALGTARANESVQLTANHSDHVVALHFEDGQQVQAGELLAELNSEQERAMLDEAAALLAEREAEHQRVVELFEREIASTSEVDAAQAQRQAARSRVERLRASIADHRVSAPFAGTLGLRQVSIGSYLQPSTVIATLDDLSVIKVDFTIPETWLGAVRVGMPIIARTDAWPDKVFPGEISAVDTRLDPKTRSATVRALVDNDQQLLRPGMLIKVEVERGEDAVLQVPEEALVQMGAEHHVICVDADSVARKVAVTVGRRRVGRVEVLRGLAEGDRVVVEGLLRARPDAPVEVVAVREAERRR